MAPPPPFDQFRFRLGQILAYLAIGLALTSAGMSLAEGRVAAIGAPLATVALTLCVLALMPRKDAS